MNETILQLLSAMLASLGYALMSNVRGPKVIGASIGGLVVWGSYLVVIQWLGSAAASIGVAALVGYFYAQILARMTKSPSTVFLVPALIGLVPGGSLYYSMLAAVIGDWQESFATGVHTLAIAGAIAVALTLGSSISLLIRGRLRK